MCASEQVESGLNNSDRLQNVTQHKQTRSIDLRATTGTAQNRQRVSSSKNNAISNKATHHKPVLLVRANQHLQSSQLQAVEHDAQTRHHLLTTHEHPHLLRLNTHAHDHTAQNNEIRSPHKQSHSTNTLPQAAATHTHTHNISQPINDASITG